MSNIKNMRNSIEKYIDLLNNNKKVTIRSGSDLREQIIISTGLRSLDVASGIGGIPTGIIMHIYGKPSSMKTHLAYTIANSVLNNNKIVKKYEKLPKCISIDLENSWDPKWFIESIGLNPNQFYIASSESAEDVLDIIVQNTATGLIPISIIDSIAALLPNHERENEMASQTMGLHARLLSKLGRKVMSNIATNSTSIIIAVNQTRSEIGPFAKNNIPTGGRALRFYSHIELLMHGKNSHIDKSIEKFADEQTTIRFNKTKVGPRYKDAILLGWKNGHGFLKGHDALVAASMMNILDQRGSWVYVNDEQICQGKANFVEMIESYLCDTEKEKLEKIQQEACKFVIDTIDDKIKSLRENRNVTKIVKKANKEIIKEAKEVKGKKVN